MKSFLTTAMNGTWIAAGMLLLPAVLSAQVSIYQFSESVEPYTEITEAEAAYSLGEPTFSPPMHNLIAWVNNEYFGAAGQVTNGGYLSGASGPGYPIGFDLTFNGDVFDRIGVANGGWISLGKSSDGNQAVWCFTADHPHGRPFVQYIGGPDQPYKRNRIAGFGTSTLRMQNMSPLIPPGPVSTLLIATIGTAPNRTCVVQYKDFRASYSSSTTLINFQIRLNEADNSVEVRYGTMVFGYQAGGAVQVGLGGRIPEDFNSRMTVYEQPAFLYDWNMTTAGLLNTDACTATAEEMGHPNGTGIPPVVGLNWKWTPDACPSPIWPLPIDEVSFESAHASWPANGGTEWEYILASENDVNGDIVASDVVYEPEIWLEGLEASTTYYLFVRTVCDGDAGAWSAATPVETLGGGIVLCNGMLLTEDYCSEQYSTKEWLYISPTGGPLKIELLGGFVGGVGTEAFQIWDGVSDAGIPAPTMAGNLAGYEFLASSGAIFIRLVTDAGACQAQDWYLPVKWRVGCKNCQDPLISSFTVVEDCDNQSYSVDVDIYSLGSSATVSLDNNLGVPSVVADATGTYTVGPFPAGQTVVVTVQNPDNPMCYSASTPLINTPCALQDCGPTTYTYCYSDNEYHQWAFQGESGQEIGIRFIRGTVGLGDHLRTYNGLDFENLPFVDNTGGLANKLFVSAAPSTDNAVLMELQSDGAVSCADEDPLFGASQEWEFVVACYDGCVQPQATFTTSCISTSEFEILVNIGEIGSTGSVLITNTGGAPYITATNVGSYPLGPFPHGTPVTVEVQGADILCTWTSYPLTRDDCSDWVEVLDCEGTPSGTALPGTACTTDLGEDGLWNGNCECIGPDGIAEMAMGLLRLHPNPSTGHFMLEIPATMAGSQLRVLDITGRMVALQSMPGTGLQEVDLGHLPNGLYSAILEGNDMALTSKIGIQR